MLIVDSIQTVFTADLEGAPGNVGQVRECAARLMRFAKESGTTVFVVGHVTKGGGIAGPKTLEHIVDTVLYFEGESTLDHRVLRATKNRFGSVDEIGVFRMTEQGLDPVAESVGAVPGRSRAARRPGSAVTALLEGTRPLLVEVQALAAKAGFGTPQRVATGFDGRRLALLLAVLDKRAGLSFAPARRVRQRRRRNSAAGAGGRSRRRRGAGVERVRPRRCRTTPSFVGEVGLGGEVRPVSQAERRVAEAANMGTAVASISPSAACRKRSIARHRASSACDRSAICFDRCSHDRRARDVGVVIVAGG